MTSLVYRGRQKSDRKRRALRAGDLVWVQLCKCRNCGAAMADREEVAAVFQRHAVQHRPGKRSRRTCYVLLNPVDGGSRRLVRVARSMVRPRQLDEGRAGFSGRAVHQVPAPEVVRELPLELRKGDR